MNWVLLDRVKKERVNKHDQHFLHNAFRWITNTKIEDLTKNSENHEKVPTNHIVIKKKLYVIAKGKELIAIIKWLYDQVFLNFDTFIYLSCDINDVPI